MEALTLVPRGHYQVWKLLLWFPEVITRYGSYRYQLSIEVYYYCAESLTLDRKNQTTGRGRYHDT